MTLAILRLVWSVLTAAVCVLLATLVLVAGFLLAITAILATRRAA